MMEAGGIAFAIPGDCNNPLCDDLTRCTSSPETSKRFAGLVESLAHCRGRGVVERNVLDRNTIHRGLPKTLYARERGTVSQPPRLEAVSVMAERWSFDGDLSGQNRPPVDGGLTCRIDRFEFPSN